VFQNYALFPHMSVRKNVAFGLQMRRLPRPEIRRRTDEAIRLVHLEEHAKKLPGQLSGGQQQRVAIARAVVLEPSLVLMDEPLSNLDAKLRVQTRAQIAALQQRLGVTTVYVTHDQVEAMTMGDRVAVLLDGILQQVDAPRALYDTPANAFVAGFIGSPAMNIRTVRFSDNGADFGGLLVPLDRDQVAAARADGGDGKITVGFRPEHCDLVSANDGGFPMVVELVEELGSDAYVHGSAKLNGDDSTDTVVVRTDGRVVPRMGETVYVRPRPGSQHVFHAVTGARL